MRHGHGAAAQAGVRTQSIASQPRTAYGIDIGGATTRVGLIALTTRTIAAARSAPTPTGGEPTALAAVLDQLMREIVYETGAAPKLVGLAIPGVRDETGDVMLRAVNLPSLINVNLRDLLRGIGFRTIVIESDANAAGWAQWHADDEARRAAGATVPTARFIYLSLGTGVGGCVILDGAIVRHTRGGPGHLGHIIVDASDTAPACPCGAHGCFEAVLQQQRSASAGPFDAASLDRVAAALATLVTDIAHLYAPDRLLLGGGVIDHAPELVERVRQRFEQHRSRIAPPQLAVSAAPLRSDDAGLIGAALLAAAR